MRCKTWTTFIVLIGICLASVVCSGTDGAFVTSDGVHLPYIDSGKGRPIVLVPGWTMAAEIWRPQIDGLSGNYRVIALDPRSQGDSEKQAKGHYPARRARDVKDLVDQLKLEKPVLVGWSLGVAEILSYAEQFGTSNVAAVVLVDGFVKLDPQLAVQFPQFLNKYQEDRKKAAVAFVKSMYAKPQTEAYLAKVTEDSLKTPTNSAMALMMGSLAHPDWSDALLKLATLPVRYEFEPQLQGQADLVKA
jgi:non-heme chloroperoxidase